VNKATALAKVKACAALNASSNGQLKQAVKRARLAGATWKEIGDTLGVSRQAATERYGKLVGS